MAVTKADKKAAQAADAKAEKKAEASLSHRDYENIRQYARALLLFVCEQKDGHSFGLDYGMILRLVLKKFPVVTYPGPHRGRPTKISLKELGKIACDLNRDAVKLPFRHRARKQ
jgi:hypothetical protein